MFRVALKGLLGHKLRFALTTLAVVLGVTFVSGAFVLTDSMEESFGELLSTAYEGTDVYVSPVAPMGQTTVEQPGSGPTLDAALADRIAEVDGVAEVGGQVQGIARVLDPDGEPIGVMGAPTFGFSWTGQDSSITLRSGRGPQAPDEATVDAATAETGGFDLGDRIQVVLPSGIQTFEVVGITGFGESDNLLGATITSFELETARRLFDKEGRFDDIYASAEPGVDPDELAGRIRAVVGPDVEVGTTADRVDSERAAVADALGFLSTALLAFAGVALFVGAFIIANTFSIVVAQRQREFALLRAVGASGRQVRLAVLLEGLLVGVVAATVGLFVGVGFASVLRTLLANFGMDLPSGGTILAPRTIIASYVIGIGVTVLATIGPARRASRIAPVEAMRGATLEATQPSRRRTLIGAVLVLVGGAVLVAGLAGLGDPAIAFVGGGAAIVMLGVAMLAPAIADPFARAVGAVPARFGVAGGLARGNARRNPRRTAATASALMIGLALVSFVTILASSIRATVGDLLTEQFRADFIVRGDSFSVAPLPDDLLRDLAGSDAIETVVGVRIAPVLLDGDQTALAGVDLEGLDEVVALDVQEGSVAALSDRGSMLVATDVLEARSLAVGDEVDVTFTSGATASLEIVGSFAAADLVGQHLISVATLEEHVAGVRPNIAYVNAAGDTEAARRVIDELADTYPITAQDQAQFREQQDRQVNQILGLMMVLLALAIVIALLGIANTLALSVFERTREVGLLRAVGMTRRQVRRMVTWESMIIAVFGAAMGLVVGTGFGWAVVAALESEGINRLVIPGGSLAIYVVAAALAGAVAALFPAIRASRLDVLEAVTAE